MSFPPTMLRKQQALGLSQSRVCVGGSNSPSVLWGLSCLVGLEILEDPTGRRQSLKKSLWDSSSDMDSWG